MSTHRRAAEIRRRTRSIVTALALASTVVALPTGVAQAATCKVNSTNDPTESQIQDIIDNAPANGTVTFSGTCFGNFSIDKNLKIVGAGSTATVDGEDDTSVFWTEGPVVVSFTNLTITNGSNMGGGGVYLNNAGVATFTKVRFIDNYALAGAAIYADPLSTVSVVNSSFSENLAEGVAGAIYATESRVSITGSTFTANHSSYAGAIFVDNCNGTTSGLPLVISRSTFSRNTANYDGGAIIVDTVPTTISASSFTSNQGGSNGGAIYAYDDCGDDQPFSITGSNFTANRGTWGAGLAAIAIGHVSVTSSKFVSNVAEEGGGVALNSTRGATIASSTFNANQATVEDGGAFYGVGLYPGYEGVHIDRSTFTGNRANQVGGAVGLFNGNWTSVEISGSTFSRNAAGQRDYWDFGYWEMREGGGAVYTQGYHLAATSSTFSSNTAVGSGGAIYFNGFYEGGPYDCGEVVLSRVTIKGNSSALGNGGGLFANGYGSPDPGDCTNVSIEASTITGNAANYGGGVYVDGYTYDIDSDIDWDQSGTLALDAASRVDGNRAAYDGGGIYVEDWHLLLQGSVSGNTAAAGGGGGLYVMENWLAWPRIAITAAKIERNTAFDLGGGIRIDGDDDGRFDLDFFIADAEGPVSISYNKLTSAVGRGGGVYATAVSDFIVSTDGYVGGGNPTVTVAYNVAKDGGGGFYVTGVADAGLLDGGLLVTRNSVGGFYDQCLFNLGGAVITGNVGWNVLPATCT